MEKQEIRTFGRRHGKKLSLRQQWLVDNLLPAISPKNEETAGKHILEIGFGGGEHLRELAIENPNSLIIGAEPFINGVASLLSAMTQSKELESNRVEDNDYINIIKPEYRNIRIWPDDVRKLFTLNSQLSTLQNPYSAFSQIWVLHPDPWPKARHEKRRLLNADFLTLLGAHIAPNGQIIIGTDHHEYYDWIVEQVAKTKLRITNYELQVIETRYQKKNKAGTDAPKYLVIGY